MNNLTDCISRQAVIDSLYDWSNHSMTDAETWHLRQVIGDIKSMPSVTPQEPKMGRWIANAPQYDMLNPQYICSECGNAHTRTTPYCEMCGAKMVEPQESEG